jgi:hypothetical protein
LHALHGWFLPGRRGYNGENLAEVDTMQTGAPVTSYIIGAIALVVVIAIIIATVRAARSRRLAQRFGPEYERTVRERGDRAAAERDLARREARVKRFHIEELPPGARARYTEEWRTVQSRFVDEPALAIAEADRLVSTVMRDRGYPLGSFEQRADDLSPDHPRVIEDYRAAHDIATRSERGQVPTEDLRQAMVHYRSLFNDLVETDGSSRR